MALIEKYGFKFFIPKKEEFIIDDCFDQIKNTVDKDSPPMTVLDIGAHVGAFSILVNCPGIVYAFEPNSYNYRLLCKNIIINKLQKKIIPFHLGFSKKCERRCITTKNSYNTGQSSFYYKKYGYTEYASMVDLPTVIEGFGIIDYLKCDCEGAEHEIFMLPSDEAEKIFKKIKYINIEIHNLDNPKYFNRKQITLRDGTRQNTKFISNALLDYLYKNGFTDKPSVKSGGKKWREYLKKEGYKGETWFRGKTWVMSNNRGMINE